MKNIILQHNNSEINETSRDEYKYGLALTSQFYFCSLPLRLDTYSKCSFQCCYCFAHTRGGAHRDIKAQVYSAEKLARRFEKINRGMISGPIDELISNRQPIHFGGMSDPFPPLEKKYRASLKCMQVLAENNHPTIISTKADLLASDEYIKILKEGNFLVQVSLTSTDDKLIEKIDRGTAGPRRIEKMLHLLHKEGIPTSCRIQPLLPAYEHHAKDVINMCAENGVHHVAIEHLKLGIEKNWDGKLKLSEALDIDINKYFEEHHAKRIGREWILDVSHRVETTAELRKYTHKNKMTFGAADSDLLLLSDGGCCCSGADFIVGFENYYKHNYLGAAQSGLEKREISYKLISKTWAPSSSIARFMNSTSRLKAAPSQGAGIKDYIIQNWNGSLNGNSIDSFYGIKKTDQIDENGLAIYTTTNELHDAIKSSSFQKENQNEF